MCVCTKSLLHFLGKHMLPAPILCNVLRSNIYDPNLHKELFCLHTFAFPLAHKMVALSSLLWEDRRVSILGWQFCLHSLDFRKVGLGNIGGQQVANMGPTGWTWENMGPTKLNMYTYGTKQIGHGRIWDQQIGHGNIWDQQVGRGNMELTNWAWESMRPTSWTWKHVGPKHRHGNI